LEDSEVFTEESYLGNTAKTARSLRLQKKSFSSTSLTKGCSRGFWRILS